MNKIYWIIIGLFIVVVITIAIISNHHNTASVIIKNKKYTVQLANTNSEREKGLSNRTNLPVDKGMLFVFPESNIWPFWMKDTLIPLDIIWLAPSKVEGVYNIIEMTTLNKQAVDYTPSYTPKNKANRVLELNAGEISKNNFQVGDTVKIDY